MYGVKNRNVQGNPSFENRDTVQKVKCSSNAPFNMNRSQSNYIVFRKGPRDAIFAFSGNFLQFKQRYGWQDTLLFNQSVLIYWTILKKLQRFVANVSGGLDINLQENRSDTKPDTAEKVKFSISKWPFEVPHMNFQEKSSNGISNTVRRYKTVEFNAFWTVHHNINLYQSPT